MKKSDRILFVLTAIVTVALLYYRRPDAFYNPQFWAEEGKNFFADGYRIGFKSIFLTLNGYLQLFPRIIASFLFIIRIPFEYHPHIYILVSLLCILAVQFFIFYRLQSGTSIKFIAALTIILIPLESEVLLNFTNIQWILALFPIIIFSTFQNYDTKWKVTDAIIITLAGLTGPTLLILLPVCLYFLIQFKKNKPILVLLSISLVIAIVQGILLIHHGSVDRTEGISHILSIQALIYLFRQFAYLLIGKLIFQVPSNIAVVITIIIIPTLTYFFIRIFKQNVRIIFICGLLFLIASLISYRHKPDFLDPYYNGVRNFFIPSITFIWAFLLSFQSRRSTSLFFILSFWFLVETFLFIERKTFIDYEWKRYALKIPDSDHLEIPINPKGWVIKIDRKEK